MDVNNFNKDEEYEQFALNGYQIEKKEIFLLMIKKILKLINQVKISYLLKLKLIHLINIKNYYFN